MARKEDWRGRVGREWASRVEALDAMLAPSGAETLAALGAVGDARVLDLGCGAGTVSLALADAGAAVTGVDISPDLIERARARAGGRDDVAFVLADAAEHGFDRRFDALFSRCGTMFFDEPVAAFAHLAAQMRPGAPMAAAAWGPPRRNDWARLPLKLCADLLGEAAGPPETGAPGPFGWADPEYFAPMLAAAGWRGVDWRRFDPGRGRRRDGRPRGLSI